MANQQVTLRDIKAHVLQLCNYVDEGYVAYERSGNGLTGTLLLDWNVLRDKAKQVRTIIMEE